jgi:hypothetical protein
MFVSAHAASNCISGRSSCFKNSTSSGTTPKLITSCIGGLFSAHHHSHHRQYTSILASTVTLSHHPPSDSSLRSFDTAFDCSIGSSDWILAAISGKSETCRKDTRALQYSCQRPFYCVSPSIAVTGKRTLTPLRERMATSGLSLVACIPIAAFIATAPFWPCHNRINIRHQLELHYRACVWLDAPRAGCAASG